MVETQKRAHIVDIAGGALIEEVDEKLGTLVENLLDLNTDYKKAPHPHHPTQVFHGRAP